MPLAHAENVRNAIFEAGGGSIGNYSECSFNTDGEGSFKAGDNTDAFVGEKGERHLERETKVEVIFPAYLEQNILGALIKSHPYEEVAYDLVQLTNTNTSLGAGIIGDLVEPMEETAFLKFLKDSFKLQVIKHSPLCGKAVKRIACCGGAAVL